MLSNDIIGVNNLNATASLTVLNVTSNLDGATLDCYFPNIGGASGTVVGVFTLKMYRKLGQKHVFVCCECVLLRAVCVIYAMR